MYKGKFRRAFPESFLFFHSFFYALTAGRRRRGIIKGRSSERSFFMSASKQAFASNHRTDTRTAKARALYMGGGTNHNAGKCSAPLNTKSTVDF